MANQKPSRLRNLTIAGITALTGCVGLVIAVAALLLGLWLDSLLGRRGPATICLITLSAPVGLYVMVKLAFALVRYFEPFEPNVGGEDEEDNT